MSEELDAYRRTVRAHYLAGIECHHDRRTDVAMCACSMWRCEPQPSVGAAVDAWMRHVETEFAPTLEADGWEFITKREADRLMAYKRAAPDGWGPHKFVCQSCGSPVGSERFEDYKREWCICALRMFPDLRDRYQKTQSEGQK